MRPVGFAQDSERCYAENMAKFEYHKIDTIAYVILYSKYVFCSSGFSVFWKRLFLKSLSNFCEFGIFRFDQMHFSVSHKL